MRAAAGSDNREREAELAAQKKPQEVLEKLRNADAQWRARQWKKDGGCRLVRRAAGAEVGNEVKALAVGEDGQEEGPREASLSFAPTNSTTSPALEKLEAQGRAGQCGKDGG